MQPTTLVGCYEYKTETKLENHYIVLDTLNGTLTGKYYGSENEGEHGAAFYANAMEHLNVTQNTIRFEIGARTLYARSRFAIGKSGSGNSIGLTKSKLVYTGTITAKGFTLKCDSQYGDCWEGELVFGRVLR